MKFMASDFDGTLYFNGEVRPGDREAIERFQREGNKFGLCSGRWPGDSLGPVFQAAAGLDFYILCSGALILDGNLDLIRESPVRSGALKPFVELCRSMGVRPAFSNRTQPIQIRDLELWDVDDETDPRSASLNFPEEEFYARDEKIYAICIGDLSIQRAGEVARTLREHAGETGLTAYQNTHMVDVAPVGCSKGEGLRLVKEHFGFTGDAACIGDSFNDLPMLEATPLSFTFRSSPPEVRDKAGYLVDSVAEALGILERL